jgi:hypothetical protein
MGNPVKPSFDDKSIPLPPYSTPVYGSVREENCIAYALEHNPNRSENETGTIRCTAKHGMRLLDETSEYKVQHVLHSERSPSQTPHGEGYMLIVEQFLVKHMSPLK